MHASTGIYRLTRELYLYLIWETSSLPSTHHVVNGGADSQGAVAPLDSYVTLLGAPSPLWTFYPLIQPIHPFFKPSTSILGSPSRPLG